MLDEERGQFVNTSSVGEELHNLIEKNNPEQLSAA